MSLLGGWILSPLVLGVVCIGLGLLAERVAGARLPAALVPGVGLATLVVIAGVPVAIGSIAPVAIPLVAGLALAGFVLAAARDSGRTRADWALAAGVAFGAFALYAAPSLLSGQGSIAGWIKLDDSAIWIAITDHVIEHGTDVSASDVSSHATTLRSWLDSGYPVGSFLPLGAAGRLSGQDLANAYMPVIAVFAAILALGIFTCVREATGFPRRSAVVALLAVQASLLYGYAQWGGIKELGTAAVLVTAAWCAVNRAPGVASLAVLAISALLGILGTAGAAWAAPLALVLGATALAKRPPARDLVLAGVVLLIGTIPMLASLNFIDHTVGGAGTDQAALGNLLRPLPLLQGAGLWPLTDFRDESGSEWLLVELALGGALAAIVACVIAIQRGRWALPALIVVAFVGTAGAVVVGAPWIDAKALAIMSGFGLAGAGAAAVYALGSRESAMRLAGGVGAAILLGGAAWSTVAAARDVNIAPRDQMTELRDIGKRSAGLGPTLQLNFNIYGNRWFLRDGDVDGATDLRTRTVHDLAGQNFPEQSAVEIDQIQTNELFGYRTVVRRRSPVASRPPAAFAALWTGDWWEAWTRNPAAPPPVVHMPLGEALNPVAVPDCARVRALARTAGVKSLVALPRRAPLVKAVDPGGAPAEWRTPDGVRPARDGVALVPIDVPAQGEWRLWVGGSVYGTLTAYIDDRRVGRKRHELSYDGEWLRFGSQTLRPGLHTIALEYDRGLRPGRHGDAFQSPLGPVALTPVADERPAAFTRVARAEYKRLCDGQTYDWIETAG